MIFLPREHGAYGQMGLAVATALGAAGLTRPALLLAASAVAAFVAHEPASVLLGARGPRAARELRRAAWRALAASAGIAALTGVIGVLSMAPAARWSLAVPAVPALLLAICSIRGHEKSWYGEVAAALTFACLAMPLSMAAGAAASSAAGIAVPFAVLFVAGTLAIRTVILRVRGGGAVRAAAITRFSTVTVAIAGLTGLTWLATHETVPPAAVIAATAGLTVALAVVARPPRPSRLRAIGWTLVASATFTAVVLVVAA